jgi:hypothetical protein
MGGVCRRVAVRGSQSWTPGALCRETRPPHWLRFPSRLRTPEPGGLPVRVEYEKYEECSSFIQSDNS